MNLLPHFWTLQYFKKWQSLEPHSSNLGGGRHMCRLTFLYRIQCSTTVIWSTFGYNAYFWKCPAWKWIYFPVVEHHNISKDGNLWSPLAPLWGEIGICTYWLFCTEFKKSRSIIFILNRKITYNNINSVLHVHSTTPEVANHIFLWRHFYLHPPHSCCVFTPQMYILNNLDGLTLVCYH